MKPFLDEHKNNLTRSRREPRAITWRLQTIWKLNVHLKFLKLVYWDYLHITVYSSRLYSNIPDIIKKLKITQKGPRTCWGYPAATYLLYIFIQFPSFLLHAHTSLSSSFSLCAHRLKNAFIYFVFFPILLMVFHVCLHFHNTTENINFELYFTKPVVHYSLIIDFWSHFPANLFCFCFNVQ